ncbi:XTP/dITP diphosphohydrolase [Anaerobacterium chartisolvens]|uniref:dITP/XTP pyrophosphatase n=2 Tax=Anaerobacterium chartisolvens TaxID=1297424 RepID=A0A369B7K4_9FIRM|nr:XTP/dITP diphosphohydrolase [Anaerobacterium chartisolvens]
MELIAATKNKGKINEIAQILNGLPLVLISMEQAGIDKDIEEYGKTFEENALIKASEIHRLTGKMVISDDSGLEVDFLNGAPGIYSARFAGEGATDKDKNSKLLELLEGVPFEKRSARFVCVIAVVLPNGESFTTKGTCEGYIALDPQGQGGFGYDPLFFIPEYNMTTAQLKPEEKNSISHRGKALRAMADKLRNSEYVNSVLKKG